ncbi:MAG: sigma-54-dependent transcriptional regulator [bacterium]
MANILVVDDESAIRDILMNFLTKYNHQVSLAESGEKAISLVQENIFDVAIVDLKMGEIGGMEVLIFIKDISPDTEVIMITGYGTIDIAVKAVRLGAYDFITKPLLDYEKLKLIIERIMEKRVIANGVKALRIVEKDKNKFANIIGSTPSMLKVLSMIEKVCHFDSAVLLTGESGTGKELVARTIHANSPRKDKPFIPINCAAIPESLQESEFFGHIRGSFTDAIRDKRGLFEEAHGGTIFLDEIADASLSTQLKLLRFLESGEIRRVGENNPIYVDTRLISATNKDIIEEIEKKKFRADLYYRINVVEIHLPPLRERKDDIPLLAQYFLKKHADKSKKNIDSISKDALSVMMEYDWYGNIREFENAIQHAVTFSNGDTITFDSLPNYIKYNIKENKFKNKQSPLSELEKSYIIQLLDEYSWNIEKVTKISGIGKTTLYRKLKEYNISRPL